MSAFRVLPEATFAPRSANRIDPWMPADKYVWSLEAAAEAGVADAPALKCLAEKDPATASRRGPGRKSRCGGPHEPATSGTAASLLVAEAHAPTGEVAARPVRAQLDLEIVTVRSEA